MNKRIFKSLIISICILSIICIFSSCNNEELNVNDLVCYYNDSEYTMEDENYHLIGSNWNIPNNAKTHKEKIFFGDKNTEDKKENSEAEIFDDRSYNMFLIYNNDLYVKKDYLLPSYKNGGEIESVIIIPNDDFDYFDDNCIRITDENDIDDINEFFIKIVNSDFTSNNYQTEKAQSSDYSLGIKYKNFSAVYDYGYISTDVNGEYGIYCREKNTQNKIYKINNQVSSILSGYYFDK